MIVPFIIPTAYQFANDLEAVEDKHVRPIDGQAVAAENIVPVIGMSVWGYGWEQKKTPTFSFFHARQPKSRRESVLRTWMEPQGFRRPKRRAGCTSRSGCRSDWPSMSCNGLLGRADHQRAPLETRAERRAWWWTLDLRLQREH